MKNHPPGLAHLLLLVGLLSMPAFGQNPIEEEVEELPRYHEHPPCVREVFLAADDEFNRNGPAAEIDLLKEERESCEKISPISRRISLKYLEWGDSDYDGSGTENDADKKELFKEGLSWALKALKEDSTDYLNYENLSMAYAATITVSRLKRKAQLADSVRVFAEESLRLNPDNDRANQILGRWHYEVSKLSPFLKFLSKILFREPQDGSFEKAEEYFKKAIEIDNIAGHRYWLAMSYLETDQEEKALEQLHILIDLPVVYHNDVFFQEEAEKLIQKYE